MDRIDCPECCGNGGIVTPDGLVHCNGCNGTGLIYEPQPDHTPGCIKHKAIFGSVGCTCKPDQSSRLLNEDEINGARIQREADVIFYEARIEALIDAVVAVIKGYPEMSCKYNDDKMTGWLECECEVKKILSQFKANPTSEVKG